MADEIPPTIESAQSEAPTEPVSASPEAETPNSKPQTAQIGGNEPLGSEPDSMSSPQAEPIVTTEQATIPQVEEAKPTSIKTESAPTAEATLNSAKAESGAELPQTQSIFSREGARAVIAKAQEAIQFGKRKKLDKVLGLFAKRTNITNDEVEKLLHVSDATATRYLSTLEKEGKIKQSGKTGKAVSYSRP